MKWEKYVDSAIMFRSSDYVEEMLIAISFFSFHESFQDEWIPNRG